MAGRQGGLQQFLHEHNDVWVMNRFVNITPNIYCQDGSIQEHYCYSRHLCLLIDNFRLKVGTMSLKDDRNKKEVSVSLIWWLDFEKTWR